MKILGGIGYKMKRKVEGKERGRRERRKIGMWVEGDKGIVVYFVVRNEIYIILVF